MLANPHPRRYATADVTIGPIIQQLCKALTGATVLSSATGF